MSKIPFPTLKYRHFSCCFPGLRCQSSSTRMFYKACSSQQHTFQSVGMESGNTRTQDKRSNCNLMPQSHWSLPLCPHSQYWHHCWTLGWNIYHTLFPGWQYLSSLSHSQCTGVTLLFRFSGQRLWFLLIFLDGTNSVWHQSVLTLFPLLLTFKSSPLFSSCRLPAYSQYSSQVSNYLCQVWNMPLHSFSHCLW